MHTSTADNGQDFSIDLPLEAAFDLAGDGMVITDSQTHILKVNHAFSVITGYSAQEACQSTPRILKSGRHPSGFYEEMWNALHSHDYWSGEIWNRKKDGSVYLEWLTIRALRDRQGRIEYYLAYFKDITELKDKENQILFMAYHDALTKLPNRTMLEERLHKAISLARRSRQKLAVFFIDLDDFKRINDSLGHDKGDELLLEVTSRIGGAIRTEDMLCRQGGDEFILLAENIQDESTVHILAARIFDVLKNPVEIGTKRIQVNASIGVSIFPDDGQVAAELTKCADMAMYRAKAEGKNKYVMYHSDMNRSIMSRLQLESEIRSGLSNAEFFLHFQPIIRCRDQRVLSLEALIRWDHRGELIAPADFIPVAEESGLIDELGWLVLEQVCTFQHRLQAAGCHLPITINLSTRQFHHRFLIDTLDRILTRHGLDPLQFEFELTEATLMRLPDQSIAIMQRLRQRGYRISIDDFGVGFSSLKLLQRMPISTLKIEKHFIDELHEGQDAMAGTIIALGQRLGFKVLAEGVESESQLDMLRTLGCDKFQGFHGCHPLPEDELLEFLTAGKCQASL